MNDECRLTSVELRHANYFIELISFHVYNRTWGMLAWKLFGGKAKKKKLTERERHP